MKAVMLSGFGDTTVFKFGNAPRPELRPSEVRLRVRASGVNRADTLQRRGLYPPPPGESDLLGLEVAGDVIEVAAGVSQCKVGDRVMALLAGGGYAEEACVDEGLVMPLPPRFSYAEGAAIPEVFITAHHNLMHLGGLFPEARLLIHAGASGVGTAGIQIARGIAKEVWVTVGNAEKAAACEKLGAKAILYRQDNFPEVIRAKGAGKAVDLILDPVGARYLERNMQCLAPNGTLVMIGLMGGREGTIDLGLLLQRRLKIIGSVLRSLPLTQKRAVVARFRRDCLEALANNELSPLVDRTLPVSEVAKAHQRMEDNLNIGKIVLVWD